VKTSFAMAAAITLVAAATVSAQTYALKAPIAAKPAFVTTVGQSADIEMVKVLLDRSAVPHKDNAQAKAGDLAASGAKTLVVVLGGSTKGLGAAGISADAEIDRAKAVLAEAKKLGMTIIGVHVGGEARRGQLSDRFIEAAVPACQYVIVVADGDKDGFISKLCGTAIPFDKVERISKAVEPLQKAFK
jgi:phosphoserine phosphatase